MSSGKLIRMCIVRGMALFWPLAATHSMSSDDNITSISIFIVHPDEKDNTQYYSTDDFPSLGFISNEPDLVLDDLESVKAVTRTEEIRKGLVGKPFDVEHVTRHLILIQLNKEEASKVYALTRAVSEMHRGTRVLFTIAGEPIYAPTIHQPLQTEVLELDVGSEKRAEEIVKLLIKDQSIETNGDADRLCLYSFQPSKDSIALVEFMGWVELLSNTPYIEEWEKLTDKERQMFEDRAKYGVAWLKRLLAASVEQQIGEVHVVNALGFLESELGGKFWKTVKQTALSGNTGGEPFGTWFDNIGSDSFGDLKGAFAKSELEEIGRFIESDSGRAFFHILQASLRRNWFVYEDLAEWFENRMNERREYMDDLNYPRRVQKHPDESG